MLTADLVHTRRRGDVLSVVPLGAADQRRARELAAAYLGLARAHVGLPRGALLEALRHVSAAAREQRLARGLLKLVLDRCVFEEGTALDPAEIRRALFAKAGAARRAQGPRGRIDRGEVISDLARGRGVAPADVESALYADLPDAHRLCSFQTISPDHLVAEYESAQVQAVLLRAVKVHALVRSSAPGAYRALFRKLKFLRLLHRIDFLPDSAQKTGGYRIEIDGPYSLFESVTRYGLQLALAFPALTAVDEWALEADVRWGHDRKPLQFRAEGRATAAPAALSEERPISDELATLLEQLRKLEGPWRAEVSTAVLDLPGLGVCVPDLAFKHVETGQTVYLEALGFWSRDAVWRRIELAERGLPHPLVFAVSKHLRVSEAALDEDVPAVLYVYSRVLNARAVLDRVATAAQRATRTEPRKKATGRGRRP